MFQVSSCRRSHANPRTSVGRCRFAGLVRTGSRRLQRRPLPRAPNPGSPEQGQPFRSRLALLLLRRRFDRPFPHVEPEHVLHYRITAYANFHSVPSRLSRLFRLIFFCSNQPFPLSDPHRFNPRDKPQEDDSLLSLETPPHPQPPVCTVRI